MIASLNASQGVDPLYQRFLKALTESGFGGELRTDYASRVVLATDNSIYQWLPEAVVFPKSTEDFARIGRLLALPEYRAVKVAPRGGGTGTNGQALTPGLVVDSSKYLNRILEINAEQGWARVEPGVVKDQLNEALKPHGFFFAPELSTSNRATIGGMISTDASGQGSCLYGKTRDHVLELDLVLADGKPIHCGQFEGAEYASGDDRRSRILQALDRLQSAHAEAIEAGFPKLNRCLTGYDLAHLKNESGALDLASLICGAEGTLGFITEAKIRVLPIPKAAALVAVRYNSFAAALEDAPRLMQAQPGSIETIDSRVLGLAMQDLVWADVEAYIPTEANLRGLNLVEFVGDEAAVVARAVDRFKEQLNAGDYGRLGFSVADQPSAIKKIWAMRKKAVGLLGRAEGEARPQPFVEDTAVPPEHLADYIMEFRALLDEAGVSYGMFGHVDAGVLHVRPALDMKDPDQVALVRSISDQVAGLTQKYGGLIWGEHGKGVRSEYAPAFFGDLYPLLEEVKALFDPYNQLNPGKIAAPTGSSEALLKIDQVPLRGDQDRQIAVSTWQSFGEAMHCNGNGLCFHYSPTAAMCPTYKVRRDRNQSPKGRASLLREWLRQQSRADVDLLAEEQKGATFWPLRAFNSLGERSSFNVEVRDALQSCMACRACGSECPVRVDIAESRSRFLHLYYQRYLRPLRHYLIGGLEQLLPRLQPIKGLYNALMGARPAAWLTEKLLGVVDSPLLAQRSLMREARALGVETATPELLADLGAKERARTLVVVQDAFTSFYEVAPVVSLLKLAQKLGLRPLLAPFAANGKPLHIHGFLPQFNRVAARNRDLLKALEAHAVPLVGLEPAITLTYRQEYRDLFGEDAPKVALVQEWLEPLLIEQGRVESADRWCLLAHCTERTQAPEALASWQRIFSAIGQELEIPELGCCGMSGTWGHEAHNRADSEKLYRMGWSDYVAAPEWQGYLMATGYSCRSQAKRLDHARLLHPVEVLESLL